MVKLAAGQDGTLTTDEELRGFLRGMDDADAFEDLELEAAALAAISGG